MPTLSPLSAQEISTILGNIKDAATQNGAGATAGVIAVRETVRGLRDWCGDSEVTLAMLSFSGLAPAAVVTLDN